MSVRNARLNLERRCSFSSVLHPASLTLHSIIPDGISLAASKGRQNSSPVSKIRPTCLDSLGYRVNTGKPDTLIAGFQSKYGLE